MKRAPLIALTAARPRLAALLVTTTLALAGCSSDSGGFGIGGGAGGASGSPGSAQTRPVEVAPGIFHTSIAGLDFFSGDGGTGNAAGGAGSGSHTGMGGTGSGEPACVPTVPPGSAPFTALCGDGFRTGFEQCDDGNVLGGDACDADCRVTPRLAIAPRLAVGGSGGAPPQLGRELGSSRHPMAAGCNTVAVGVTDRASTPPALKLASFSMTGNAGPVLQFGSANVDDAAPAVAAFTDDTFAVAWTDFESDGDELGIRLRKIDPGAPTQAPATFANSEHAFSQRAPDAIFDGKELVVAWVDDSDPVSGPDLRYRTFDQGLQPTSADTSLAATGAVEDNVALAAFNGAWAAAWRSGIAGNETIEVQSGTRHWTIGPFLPGATGDRPALAFVDEAHLAVAFSEGTDPTSSGVANVPRLYAAVLDAAFTGQTLAFQIAPKAAGYANDPTIGQSEPALTAFADRLLLSWRSDAVPGDALGEELWSRSVTWAVSPEGTVQIDASAVEVPLLSDASARAGDQRMPALLSSVYWPDHRLLTAWEDLGQTFAPSGPTEVGLQFSEVPAADSSVMWVSNWDIWEDKTYGFTPEQYRVAGTHADAPNIALTSLIPSTEQNQPVGVAFEPDGDMWQIFCNGVSGQRLLKFNANKLRATSTAEADVSITMPYPDSSYGCASSIGFDGSGNLWVGFINNHLIRFGPGQLLESGSPTPQVTLTSPFFYQVIDIQADGDDLLVASYQTRTISRLSPSELSVSNPNFVPSVQIAAFGVTGMALAPHGDLWVADWDDNLLHLLSAADLHESGNPTPLITLTNVPGAESIAFDPHGKLWVTSWQGNQVYGFAPDQLKTSGDKVPETTLTGGGALYTPYQIRFSPPLQTPEPPTRTFPLSADGHYYNVDILRRAPGYPAPTAEISPIGPSQAYVFPPYSAFDGDDSSVSFVSTTVYPFAADPTAGQVLTIDLGRVVSLSASRQQYPGTYTAPDTTRLRVAEAPGDWVEVAPTESIVRTGDLNLVISHEFPPTRARYIELTQIGVPASGIVSMYELSLYPSATTSPPPSTADGYDITQLTGLSASIDSQMWFGNNLGDTALWDKNFFSMVAGKTAAQGGTADGAVTLDLGDWFAISEIDTAFYAGDNWQGGGMIEISSDQNSWTKVYDSGRGHQFGPGGFGPQAAHFAKQTARYIRITDYFISGVGLSPNAMEEVQVF